ncbi:MAG TPA: OmpA family protein [Longimicrobiales bacterium]|nr:OmpA family protein [Longimicrobiales bacterium]
MIAKAYKLNTRTLIAATVSSVLLAACAAAPQIPAGAAQARSKLTQLQAHPELATRAPVAIKEADLAVTAAETPQTDQELGAHQVYIADRKVDTAWALAESRLAEDQRAALGADREGARLDARTREADAARLAAAAAQADAVTSQMHSERLQREIDDLQAKETDRGLVLILGDVLFESGKAQLKAGATGNLNKLVMFLNNYPNRTVLIEGYTDSVGSDDYNQGLSSRRAESVQSYLVGQGIDRGRLTASGLGESAPVADNESATGRQLNRRVEVIISNPDLASR